jgi:hypothetical protein
MCVVPAKEIKEIAGRGDDGDGQARIGFAVVRLSLSSWLSV